ncbi:MAG: DUF3667 domain-containing protein [Rhodanobacteraceae bacterium]|nr:MAG: DUF3667 domain-containing protein [Rhodanobacteraceae bacterium]
MSIAFMPTADSCPAISGSASFTVARRSRAKCARSKDRIKAIGDDPMQPEISPSPAPPETPTSAPPETCANCGTPLQGKYCYACGQPVNGLVRHFGSVMSDIADSVLNVDERLFRTIGPLYFQPGKLTLDYFAGKRARYVTPFRMVFFLAIVAFFAAQFTVRAGFSRPVSFTTPRVDGVAIHTAPASSAPPEHNPFADGNLDFGWGVIWNRDTKPFKVGWLPDAANDWFNDLLGNAQVQLNQMNSGNYAQRNDAAHKFMLGMFSAAPTVLFVLLPVFALMLKIFYVFKRRLYMEHLIVAMHSHAFLMLSMLVIIALTVLQKLLLPHAGWLAVPFGLLFAAVWIWIFVYLWLMQKRVYRQGWFMTNLKYWCLGFCYSFLLLIGFVFVMLLSLTGA